MAGEEESVPSQITPPTNTASASDFIGDAEAVLAISENADQGIIDLVDAYKSNTWDDSNSALQIVEDYATKLREKHPSEENLLSTQETLDIAPIKPEAPGVDYYIQNWEKENLAKVEESDDPYVRAYESMLPKAIEDAATTSIQQANETSQFTDKSNRVVLGAVPGLIKVLGAEKYFERQLRADSNDSLASAVASGAGSVIALPLAPINIPLNAEEFGREEYTKSRTSGASKMTAAKAGGLEGLNQAADIVLDKIFLGTQLKKGVGVISKTIQAAQKPFTQGGFVKRGITKAIAEGTQEFAQNKITQAADYVGLNRDEYGELITDADTIAFSAGAIVGGGAHTVNPGASNTAQETPPSAIGDQIVPDLSQELGLSPDPELLPPRRVAVVGEPVSGGANVTTVEDAPEGNVDPQDSPILGTDNGEIFVENPDGTISRVVDGAKKQPHSGAILVSEENANKLAGLQGAEPGGYPVIIQQDDLGRPFIKHPNVMADLTVDEDALNTDPVMIEQADTGHVLQYSERTNELGSTENSATISKGKSAGVSTAGAAAAAESSIADKLRANPNLNPQVKELLGLDTEFATGLLYAPDTNAGNLQKINNIFERFNNSHAEFSDYLLNKDWGDITIDEGVAAAFSAESMSNYADSVREANPDAANQADIIAAKLSVISQKIATDLGQGLQKQTLKPFNGESLILAAKADSAEFAKARAAEEIGVPLAQVESVEQENRQLDSISEGLHQREFNIQEAEVLAQERHDAPDKVVAEIEQELTKVDETSPAIQEAQTALDEVEKTVKETETKAAGLEKEADNIETAQEEVSQDIKDLTRKVEELSAKPIEPDTSKVDALKAKREKSEKSPTVVSAEAKVKAAKGVSEKAAARLELTKAINEEKARGIKERAALDAEIKAAQEAHADERARLQKEKHDAIKAAKEELTAAKKEASTNKKSAALEKRKQANELRAENKRIRAEKEEALREARKQRAAETTEKKRELKERLNNAKTERAATKQLRKEQLALEKEQIKAARDALKQDREKIATRKDRNKKITDAVNKYKKEFTDKLTPETTNKINELVQMVKTSTGMTKKNALNELGRTIADVKGVELQPGADPWATFWQANVLSSISTNTANIVGNSVLPIKNTIQDLARGKVGGAYRFVRGWTEAMLSGRTISDIRAGFMGELDSRADKIADRDVKDLSTGTLVIHENDAVKTVQKLFGTGKLGKLLSSPVLTLRMLGAMDAVFSRAAKEGYIARDEPSYTAYLNAKASDYNKYVTQARNEEAQLKKHGVKTAKNFVNMRADELSFEARPEIQKHQITRSMRKDVFQEEGGPRGLTGKTVGAILNFAGNIPFAPARAKTINAKWTVASALHLTNKIARDGMGIDQVYPLVVRGVSQGKILVINGQEVGSGSTKELLGNLIEAVNKNQIISLKGDSFKPLKYAVGMFVNTGSQILDMSVEALPGIGYIDKRLGGKWTEYTAEEKAQLRGNQLAMSVLTGSLLLATLPNMEDEENAPWYIYGGMIDEKLRKSYEAKGIRPFSVRIGTTTISYKDIPGINLILGGIGNLSDAYMVAKRTPERPLTVGSAMATMSTGVLYASTQMSLMKNVGVFTDLLTIQDTQGLNSAADIFSNIASGFVPFAGAAREAERFTYGDLSRPKALTNRMLQNIPFAKFVSDNKPALNIFGEELRPTVYPGVSRFIGEATESFELDWALRNGYTFSIPKAGTKLTSKQLSGYTEMLASDDPENFEPYLTDDDQREYIKEFGPRLKAILGDYANSYPQGYDESVQKRLTKEINREKKAIKRSLLNQ